MKRILVTSLLALASNLAFAAASSGSGWHSSLRTFERGDPDAYQASVPGSATKGNQSMGIDSLDQFEMGDPDAVVINTTAGSTAHQRPTVSHATSLSQFERGDPDVYPGT